MKLLRVSVSLFLAHGASAQETISQLGGFTEQVGQVPSASNPVSLFLQQDQPNFAVASPLTDGSSSALMSEAAPMAVAAPAAPPPPPVEPIAPAPKLPSFARPKGVLTLRSMRVANPGSEGSKLFFGPNTEFAMGTDSAGNFEIQQASAPSPLLSLNQENILKLGSSRVEALSLNALNGISVRGVKQWQLVYSDDFSSEGTGWSRADVTQCGGVFMLGGFCKFSKGEVNKTFTGLPPHKQLRVVATYHFIDRWIGETAYMKLNVGMSDCPVAVWSERYAQQEAKNGISLCGDAGTPEGKFSAPIDVTVPHHKDSVTVTFGSTMDDSDPCDESWGISSVEIHVRN